MLFAFVNLRDGGYFRATHWRRRRCICVARARPIIPGTTYLLTRRCVQRQFWLLPTRQTTAIVEFCVAEAARKCKVQLHAVSVMSNHLHIVLTDVAGRLPEFTHWAFKFIGTCINVSLSRWGSIFEQSEKTSLVRLITPESIVDKIAYTVANPVSAGLVDAPSKWKGVWGYYGSKQRVAVQRPKVYFRENSEVEASATLAFCRPPGFDDESDRQLVKRIRQAVLCKVRRERERIRESKRQFLGFAGVLRQNPWQCPETRETRRKISPRVAGANKWARREALRFLREWYAEYCAARDAFCEGDRDVVFPAGTYAMRLRYNVRCAPCVT